MSNKAYKKIYVNGNCVVDFSDKVSNDDVIKGRYFYNKKGDIEEGTVDPSGQALGTAKKFVITPGTTEFRVPHGWNYGEDDWQKPTNGYIFKDIEELVIPRSLTTLYPDSFVCGYSESIDSVEYTGSDSLKTIKFENFSEFINNINCIIPTNGDYSLYANYEEGASWYSDYSSFGWCPWRLANKKPYKLLDGDTQIKYFKMPLINDGKLPPNFFSNLYIDTLELAEGYTSIEFSSFSNCYINRLILPSTVGGYLNLDGLPAGSIREIVYAGEGGSFGESTVVPIASISQSPYNDATEDGFITLKEDSSCSVGYVGTTNSIVIPDYITTIGHATFRCLNGLTSITIPDSVTSIGDDAFEYCTSLTSIEIPDSVTSIGNSAFTDCTSLTNIEIPDSVTSIGSWAFRNCNSLTSINIPNGVTSIGNYAFRNCSSLTSIEIPNSVTSIKADVFYGCSSLTSITIPDSVTSIEYEAFRNCTNLTSVTIPNSVTTIGSYAFYKTSGQKLDVYCTSTTPPTIQSTTFYSNYINKIYVPTAEAVTAYKAATNWSTLSSKIVQGVKE